MKKMCVVKLIEGFRLEQFKVEHQINIKRPIAQNAVSWKGYAILNGILLDQDGFYTLFESGLITLLIWKF